MKLLDMAAARDLLAELEVLRIAVFDAGRQATYALPMAFVLSGRTLHIALPAGGRMAQILPALRQVGLEADDVRPDLRFRSVAGRARPELVLDGAAALAALAIRYGTRWRPKEPQVFALHIIALEGRSTLDSSMK